MVDRSADYTAYISKIRRVSHVDYVATVPVLDPIASVSPVTKEAYAILTGIKDVSRHLQSTKSAYFKVERHFGASGRASDDSQAWATADEEVDKFVKTCRGRLSQFRSAKVDGLSTDARAHINGIYDVLGRQLSRLADSHTAQKQMRARFTHTKWSVELPSEVPPPARTTQSTADLTDKSSPSKDIIDKIDDDEEDDATKSLARVSAQERMLLENENKALLDELLGVEKQAESVQRKVLEISDLNAQVATHVMSQRQQIEHIQKDALETVDTIMKGNAVLKRVSEMGVSWRNFMLMFFLVLSFVLLFLNWYY